MKMEDNISSNNIDPLFWLPSDFLSDNDDDNIVMDQDNLNLTSNTHLPTEFPFDFTELTRYFASESENKWALLGSPQSILSPVLSNGSPNGPSSPIAQNNNHSWNLICAAAGEVNMWNIKNLTTNNNRALPTPPNYFPPLPSTNKNTHVKQNSSSVWGPPCRVSDEYGWRRASLPFQPEWSNLQVKKQHFNVNGCVSYPSMMFSGGWSNVASGGVGLKKKCAGTGVFLPRTCPDPVKPGGPASVTPPSRPAPALNTKYNYNLKTQAQAQPTIDALLTRRNAVLAGNRAMNCKMLLPEQWFYS